MNLSLLKELALEILFEGEKERKEIADLAKTITSVSKSPSKVRSLGRVLKNRWQSEADINSFKNVTFIHWQDIGWMSSVVSYPRRRDEISTIPYNSPPWTQLRGLRKISSKAIGAIISGHPTLIANADLNSNAFKDGKVPFYEIPEEAQDHRRKSSGWKKYPGPRSPGSSVEDTYLAGDKTARSWEDYLVYSASEIAPHEKISFDVTGVFQNFDDRGWPEALISNWKVEGLVFPDSVIKSYGIEELLEILSNHGFPDGIPIFDENGEERSATAK